MIALIASFALSGAPSLATVLQHVRSAVGFEAYHRISAPLMATGTTNSMGTWGGYRLFFSSAGQHRAEISSQTIGPKPQSTGFDGRVFWNSDWTGATSTTDPASGGDRLLLHEAITHLWISSPRRYRVRVGKATQDEIDLELESRDRLCQATVTVSRKSWLPTTMIVHSPGDETRVALRDYRTELGLNLPHTVTVARGTTKDKFWFERVRKVSIAGDEFRMPQWRATDTRFDGSKPPNVEAMTAGENVLLVHPEIDGKDVGWFILDSGASTTVIDPEVANGLGLKAVGRLTLIGVGGAVEGHLRQMPVLSLGPATIRNLVVSELDLSWLGDRFGKKVVGVLGFDLFRRAIVEIDVSAGAARIFDPTRYRLPEGQWEPLGLSRRGPYVTAAFGKSGSGPFRLDSGGVSAVVFNAKAIQRFGLMEGQKTSAGSIGGVGGDRLIQQGAVSSFELGSHRIENLEAVFQTDEKGVIADRFLLGNIGRPLMRPFRVVFDYGGYRIAFLPHKE